MESEEFLNQMIETLSITIIDRRSNGGPCKRENKTIEKIGRAPIFFYYIYILKGLRSDVF